MSVYTLKGTLYEVVGMSITMLENGLGEVSKIAFLQVRISTIRVKMSSFTTPRLVF